MKELTNSFTLSSILCALGAQLGKDKQIFPLFVSFHIYKQLSNRLAFAAISVPDAIMSANIISYNADSEKHILI